MKKFLKILALAAGVCVMSAMLFGCAEKAPDDGKKPETAYYLTGSFNGYAVDSADYKMEKVVKTSKIYEQAGFEDAELYTFTVPAASMKPDEVNGGHFYKVTAGDWDNCWGVDTYELQPAPVAPNGAGLGSIYIPETYKGDLLVIFNAKDHKIYDNTMEKQFSPRIYGDFKTSFDIKKDYNFDDADGAFMMTEKDGVWEATFELPAYKGTAEKGAVLYVVTSTKCYLAVNSDYDFISWGAGNQYSLTTELTVKPDKATTYTVTYDPATGKTTIVD